MHVVVQRSYLSEHLREFLAAALPEKGKHNEDDGDGDCNQHGSEYTRSMRIASLSPTATEILFAIGAGSQVVCVDKYSDTPSDVARIPHIPEHQRIDADALAAYKPDIVFTATLVQEKLAAFLKLQQQFAVIHHDPRSLGDIDESIRSIGLLLGKEKEANQLVATMHRGYGDVRKKAKLLGRKPRVYVEEWHHPPMVSGNWVPELVQLAGGVSLPLPPRSPSREVSLAEVEAFDPDIVVLSICGAGKFAEKRLLTDRPGWNQLRAVTSNAVFVIDDSLLNRPGPRVVEGAQRLYGWMFQVLH